MSSLKSILTLRLTGKCSIEGISSVMQQFGMPFNSVGHISQTLSTIGRSLGNTVIINDSSLFKFVFCPDEIFAKDTPILITVDPVSMTILQMQLSENCKNDAWKAQWQHLDSMGYIPLYFVKDEGVGMKKAQQSLYADVENQSDTFHAVSHRLGLWADRLEKSAYKAISYEYESLELLAHSRSEEVRNKRIAKYLEAKSEASIAIALFENFEFLYHCLLACFQCFDNKGKLKNAQNTKEDFDVALEMIKTLENKEINKEIKTIEQCKKDLFYFLTVAEKIVTKLSQTIDNDVLQPLCLAHQLEKNIIKLKYKTALKNTLKKRKEHILNDIKEYIGIDYETTKSQVYKELDNIIQSSAAVECINSLLRPYLNTCKNQPTQELLNLFMFYHNHKRFSAGKRKGKTPIELFTGQVQQEDWLDLMLKKAI